MNLPTLSLLWICWCVQHSVCIEPAVIAWVEKKKPGLMRYYRFLYNAFALCTLIPLLYLSQNVASESAFRWQGGWGIVRIILLCIAMLLYYAGAKRYDMMYFLGVRQIRSGEQHLLLSKEEDFIETGIFAVTRHPWYLATLIFIWSFLPVYSVGHFVVAVILTSYLLIGTWLEERKILRSYGESYRRYRQHVSMFVPWKWLKRKIFTCYK